MFGNKMALLSWIWKLETSFVKNSNHLQRSLHAFHVQTDDSRIIHCFENGWSSDSHEYLRHLGKGQNVSRGHNILIFLIKRSQDFFLFCVTTRLCLGKKPKCVFDMVKGSLVFNNKIYLKKYNRRVLLFIGREGGNVLSWWF